MPAVKPVKTNDLHSADPDKLHAKCDECEEEEQAETVLRKEVYAAAADPVPPDDGAQAFLLARLPSANE